MNTQPDSLEETPSLTELATAAKRADSRAHRRTLVVTISIACAAMVAMLIWSLALKDAADKARVQALIAQEKAGIAREQAGIA